MTPSNVERLPACPCCGEEKFRRRFRKHERDFWRCIGCGMERQFPLPELEELKAYYESSYADGMYLAFAEAEEIKRLTARRRLKEIGRYTRPGRWLDVGCATGAFVREAADQGHDACGIDLAARAVEHGKGEGLVLECATIDELDSDDRFDNVTAFDVIEHLLDPKALIVGAYERLRPEGTLVVSTCNVASWVRRLMGERWYFYIPEEHLFYFDPRSMKLLLERHGFTVIKCRGTAKVLTWTYSLVQFREYNPLIYSIGNAVSRILPTAVRGIPVPLFIGEFVMVAKRPRAASSA